jgi:anti-sigma B factor antagonist
MMTDTTRFETTVRHEPGTQVAVVEMSGEINALAEHELNDAYAQAIASDPARILLNFGRVDYINSTGIALIVGLLARARKEHRAMTACGLSDHYREVFEITRLADFMSIFPDEASAVSGLPASAH